MKPRVLITTPVHPDRRDLYNAAAAHLKIEDGLSGHIRRCCDSLLARARASGMIEPKKGVI